MSTNFAFPTFYQLYPDEKRKLKLLRDYLRYRSSCILLHKQCEQLTQFINQSNATKILFNQHLYRVNTLLSMYCDKRFNGQQRLNAIIENFTLAEVKFGQQQLLSLVENSSLILSELTDELILKLNINQIDPYEGFFSLNIQNKQTKQRIYDASFTFLAPNKLLISSIQGPSGEAAQALVRESTKEMHGVRPMFMLIHSFKLLAQKLNCELIGIPHKYQAKYRWNDSSKLLFNYDEFWRENNAEMNQNYWQIPYTIERKSLEEIASKKRSMYRKRYEMFDKLALQISQLNLPN